MEKLGIDRRWPNEVRVDWRLMEEMEELGIEIGDVWISLEQIERK